MQDLGLDDERRAGLKPLEGTIRRLESTLFAKSWKRLFYALEDDKLCFYKDHNELEASDVMDLSKVTSVTNKPYRCGLEDWQTSGGLGRSGNSAKPKDEEKWQIELVTAEGKVYLCADSEDEMNAFIKNLSRWIDYFMAEVSTASKDVTVPPKFSISNSERQNAQNLKGYYAQLRRDGGGAPKQSTSSPRIETTLVEPKSSTVDIDSPERGGMYRSASGRELGGAALSSPMKREGSGIIVTSVEPSVAVGSSAGISSHERVNLQREEITTLTLRLKQALDAEAGYRKEIEQLKAALSEKDVEVKKQLEELTAGFEAKKRSFNFIVNSKDFEIEKLRQEKQKLVDAKIKELEDLIALRDREITELKAKLNDKEIEILERKESEMALQEKFETTVATVNKDSLKKLADLQETFNRLKDRYFFALALSSKALQSVPNLDLNALYDRCLREQVALDQWQEWLEQFSNENQRAEGEEENVENF